MMESLEEQPLRERHVLLARINPSVSPHDNEFIHLPVRQPHSKERLKNQPPIPSTDDKLQVLPTCKQPAVVRRKSPQLPAGRISQLNINFVPAARLPPPGREPRTMLAFPQKKYRRRPMLPQLINAPLCEFAQPCTSKNRCGADEKPPKSQESGTSQTKMLDLMISTTCIDSDILKQEDQPHQQPKTPTNRTQFRPTRFRTEPSVDGQDNYFNQLSCGKAQTSHKPRVPKVLDNDLMKHSMNMNVVRKKLLSEHRNRFEDKSRQDIKSSQNHTRVTSSKHPQKSNNDEMQMTFYPRPPPKTVEDLYDNEFISVADINWIRK